MPGEAVTGTGAEAARRFFPSGITQLRRSASLVFQASLESSPLPPVPSGCILMANRCPLPEFALQTPRSSTQPLSTLEHTLSGWVGRAGISTMHTFLTLSYTLVAVFSSYRERGSPSVPTELPPVGAFPGSGDLSSLQIPPRFCGFHLASFPLPFPLALSSPTWLSGNLSCPLRCPSSFAHVQQGSVRIFPLQDVFLMLLWREMNSTSSESSAILTASVSVLGLI